MSSARLAETSIRHSTALRLSPTWKPPSSRSQLTESVVHCHAVMSCPACSRRILTALLKERPTPRAPGSVRTIKTHVPQKPKVKKVKPNKSFPDDFYIPFDPTPLSKTTATQVGPSAATPSPAPFHPSVPQGRNEQSEDSSWISRGSQVSTPAESDISLVLSGDLKAMSKERLQRVIEKDFFFDTSSLRGTTGEGLLGLSPKGASVAAPAQEKYYDTRLEQPPFGSRKAKEKAKTQPSKLIREERLNKWRSQAGIAVPEDEHEVEEDLMLERSAPVSTPSHQANHKTPPKSQSHRPATTSSPASTKVPFSNTTDSSLPTTVSSSLPLARSFNPDPVQPSTTWLPTKRLSPDALDGVRALHARHPTYFTIPMLAEHFSVPQEAIKRILRSTWRPDAEEQEERRERWDRRGARIWTALADKGEHPPKRWRMMGIGAGPRKKGPSRVTERSNGRGKNEGVEEGWEEEELGRDRLSVRKDVIASRPEL